MPGMDSTFVSNGLELAYHLGRPPGEVQSGPGVILCHGFPIGPLDAERSGGTFPQLMDRAASSLGCVTMTFNFRGCGASEGDFSLQGWVDDLRAAISHLMSVSNPDGVILIGTNTGGSIAVCVGADDPGGFGGGALESTGGLRRLGAASPSISRTRRARSGRSTTDRSHRRPTSGRASSGGSDRLPRLVGSRHGRCW